jgi:predicted ATPase with chaperone activity
MVLSLVQSRALIGLDTAAVTVEVHLANGLPSFTLVGLADVEVKEARVLPEMTLEEALQSAAIGSVSGRFTMAQWGQRPTCSPHHSASAVALVGGGSPPRPGGHHQS